MSFCTCYRYYQLYKHQQISTVVVPNAPGSKSGSGSSSSSIKSVSDVNNKEGHEYLVIQYSPANLNYHLIDPHNFRGHTAWQDP